MRVPKNAKKVFSGIIFDVYHWPQKMFDGSFKTFERLVRQNTVVIIPTVGNKILVQEQQQPDTDWYYDLPSGRMDIKGESPKNAALRELLEETGYKPAELKLWKIYEPGGKILQKVYFFIARGCKKVVGQALDPGERIKIHFKSFDEFLKMTDLQNAYLGPLTVDLLLGRVHNQNRNYLKKVVFGAWNKPPKPPKSGPSRNW